MWMTWVVEALAYALMVPVGVLLLEVLAAVVFGRRSAQPLSEFKGHIAVIVPAHDESEAILPTLSDIREQLRAGDRLLVVADNCTDDTASVVAAAGIEVVERSEPDRRGKGYALEFGVGHLWSRPPDVVIFFDADCRLEKGAIDNLASSCAKNGRPTQALYLMKGPVQQSINYQVAEFAWRVKNWLRPLGLFSAGLPVQLVGTGMAIPWGALSSIDLGSGAVVEDLKLGLDLAAAGHAPQFCPAAVVTSTFAASREGASGQRRRWESGHIFMIIGDVPRLLLRALLSRNWNLLVLALDLAVPPLALLALLVATTFFMASAVALLTSALSPLIVGSAVLAVFASAVLLAWFKAGREVLPAGAVLLLFPYLLQKIALYCGLLSRGRETRWIRTDRDPGL